MSNYNFTETLETLVSIKNGSNYSPKQCIYHCAFYSPASSRA